jgi:hypothetical protein
MPIRAHAAGSRASPHSALGRSRDDDLNESQRRRQSIEGRAMRRMRHGRYRVYAEDEFFAAVADEHESPLELSSSSGVEAPRKHRVASVAVLVGVVGAVAGVVAVDVLAHRGAARRKAASLRVARVGAGTATVTALRRVQPRPVQAGRALSSAERRRIRPAGRPREHKSRRRSHDGGTHTGVEQANVAAASTPLANGSRRGHAVALGAAGPTSAQPVDEHADRLAIVRSDEDVAQRSRVEFGFER